MEEEEQLLLTKEFDAVQEGWNKLTSGVSSVIGSGVRAADDFIDQNIPGGEQFTARWRKGAVQILKGTARFVQQEFEAADRQVDEPIDSPGDIPYFVAGAFNRGKQQYTENARRMAESAGIDPRAGDVLGEVAGEIATFGTGKLAGAALDAVPPGTGGLSPQVATAGGMVAPTQMTPQITKGGVVMKAVTITDQPTLEAVGVKTGQKVVTPKQGRRLIRRDMEIDRLKGSIQKSNEQLDALLELQGDPDNLRIFLNDNPEVEQLMGMYEGRPDQIKKVTNRLRERRMGAQESLSRQQSNVLPFDETDPNFFRNKEGLAVKKDEEVRRGITGYLEQHHLFPKGISAAFFGKMDDLISKGKADKDDLIVMAEYAVKQGKRTGDVKSNLINMQKDPHNELHTMLRASGAELGKTDYVRSLKDVKDVNELIRRWRDMLDSDVAYNVDTAKVWEPLNDLIKEVRSTK
tara:strand:- start:84 stop:1469 length:1386 start_codon:yes stop_codon:yes gene_type:complete